MSAVPRDKAQFRVAALGALAAFLFIALFRLQRLGPLDFWAWLTANVVLLTALAFLADKTYLARLRQDARSGLARKLAVGIGSAAILYAVFAVGHVLSAHVLTFAEAGVARVYALRAGAPGWRIALLIGLVIGPGEELFWRGFFQDRAAATTCPSYGLALSATLYTAVHLASGNLMLVIAAAVCGVFWGWLYMRFRSPLVNIVSHVVWDLAVFLFLPFL